MKPTRNEARRRLRPIAVAVPLVTALGIAGCRDDVVIAPSTAPRVSGVSAESNPSNVLSLLVSAAVQNADSARVRYWPAGGSPMLATPYYPVQEGAVTIAALGLAPQTNYSVAVEAVGVDTAVLSAMVQASTPDLPPQLQHVRLALSGTPTSGYILLPVGRVDTLGFAVAFDSTGAVAWYRAFPLKTGERLDEPSLQPNGNYTAFVGVSTGWQPDTGKFYEFRPDGQLVGSYRAPAGLYTDEHELLLTANGRAHLFAYDRRHVDQTSIQGPSDALVSGHTLLRLGPAGEVEFQWNAWDHFPVTSWTGPVQSGDFDHPNSLAFDLDGNYVVSFRNLSQILKIDSQTGQVLWRFGERDNQFTVENDPLNGPSYQHAVRVLDNGHLLMYDNGVDHDPAESRAVEYALDPRTMTATMVWEYRHNPPIYTQFVGYVQRFRNQNTLVSFGLAGVVDEVTPAGQVVWEGTLKVNGQTTSFYRARRLTSLYRFDTP